MLGFLDPNASLPQHIHLYTESQCVLESLDPNASLPQHRNLYTEAQCVLESLDANTRFPQHMHLYTGAQCVLEALEKPYPWRISTLPWHLGLIMRGVSPAYHATWVVLCAAIGNPINSNSSSWGKSNDSQLREEPPPRSGGVRMCFLQN